MVNGPNNYLALEQPSYTTTVRQRNPYRKNEEDGPADNTRPNVRYHTDINQLDGARRGTEDRVGGGYKYHDTIVK